jgi:type VI secretion system protein ImpL
VWAYGPLLPVLEPGLARAAAILLLLLLWAVGTMALLLTRRGRDAALAAGIADATEAAAAEQAAQGKKLAEALAAMKRAGNGHTYLHELPWYAIIGPPGAGKTTALLNAGLHFPLAERQGGAAALAGVGGTRNCDWWFTDQAVLIDTAGRYTTQDSDAAADRAGWDSFLKLLRRTRPGHPLNGVLVAISLADLALASPQERDAHARTIAARLAELEQSLGLRLPVYVLFTKADLIAGFNEFFDDLDRDGRARVWGATFPLRAGTAPEAAFAAAFDQLVARLQARLLPRLAEERGVDRRALIAGFPLQVASLREPLADFIRDVFTPRPPAPPPLLRGAYLTSGTQEGTPFDRLTGTLTRLFGVDQRRAARARPEYGRSYFLTDLLHEVIFNEAMLVAERPGAAQRRAWAKAIVAASFAVFLLAAAGVFYGLHGLAGAQIRDTETALDAYQAEAQGIPLATVSDADLLLIVGLLNRARALPFGAASGTDAGTRPGTFARLARALGVDQSDTLGAAARTLYRHALQRALLPRLQWRLESQIRGNLNQLDFLYEATRVYLMLGGAGPLDPGLVRDWMALDWEAAYPGPALAPARQALRLHLDALLAEPLPRMSLDGDLVARARAALTQIPLAQRVYSRIRPSAAAQAVPPWRPIDSLGGLGRDLFVRASGKPLDQGVPGFFTVQGFHTVLLPSLDAAIRATAADAWVLGQPADAALGGVDTESVKQQVLALYIADYENTWDAMLGDLDLAPLWNLATAAEDLFVIASPRSPDRVSPVRDLLASIARQLTLSAPPNGSAAVQDGAGTSPGTDPALRAVFGAQPDTATAATLPGHEVDERYKALRELVGSGPSAPIDAVLHSLTGLRQQLAKMAAMGTASQPPAGPDPSLMVRVEAARQPPPLSRWLITLANSGGALRSGNPLKQVIAAWNASGGPGPLCQAATQGWYPFAASSPNDMSLNNFSQVFSPGGLLDSFFQTQIKPWVNTAQQPWAPQPFQGQKPPLRAVDVLMFQRAAEIRDTFFASGPSPSLRFDIAPLATDATARQAILELDGIEIGDAAGPARTTQVTWPGSKPVPEARLSLRGEDLLRETGPWAVFRLLAHARVLPPPPTAQAPHAAAGAAPLPVTPADRIGFAIPGGGLDAEFQLHANTTPDPLLGGLLQNFQCPSVQAAGP